MRVANRRLLLLLLLLLLVPPMLVLPTRSMGCLPPLISMVLEFFRFPRPARAPLLPLVLRAPNAGGGCCCRATGETRAAPSLLLVVVVVGIMVWASGWTLLVFN